MTSVQSRWRLELANGRGSLELSRRPKIMGIVNITPDSFSDGGLYFEAASAIEHALDLVRRGAQILDLGAESTRPGGGVYGDGCDEIDPQLELDRLLPVIEGLRPETDVPISIDTRKGEVARQALEAGGDLINDVGGLTDEEMIRVVADAGSPVIAMHSRGSLPDMQRTIQFDDVVAEVATEQGALLDRAEGAGLDRGQLILDPGIGFGKTRGQNLLLLKHLEALCELNRPVLVGASRKSFIAGAEGPPPNRRLGGSLAAAARAAAAGASILRVHDVEATVQFLDVSDAIDLAV